LQKKIEKIQASGHLTEEEREILVNGQKLIDAIENRGLERGRSEGRQQGQREGRQQGLDLVAHQFTRKLGRPLTERQRATILRRFDTLGPERLGDVVLDLDAAALAAWLANPRAQ
jgi:predicted transposase YdaD